ncbi:hypothetical protein CapIbe_014296 [Capra ibex]
MESQRQKRSCDGKKPAGLCGAIWTTCCSNSMLNVINVVEYPVPVETKVNHAVIGWNSGGQKTDRGRLLA